MAEDQEQLTVDGQGVQQQDLNLAFREAALADDAVLAELLRLAPFNESAVAKAVVPYGVAGVNGAMVAPNGASGSVLLQPHRVVVGARTAVSATPGTATLNWKDVRSRAYAPTDDNATLGHKVSFVANASGNPRWDVVCMRFDVDQNGPTASRNVRAPGTSATVAPVATPVVPNLTQVLTPTIIQGTPASSPAVPAITADVPGATGTYYVPIAAVLIPNGFGATTTVLGEWIQMLAPIVPLSTAFGAVVARPPNRLSSALSSALMQTWGASGTRPTMALPCTRTGGVRMSFPFDATTATPPILDGAVLDDSMDWRGRTFTVKCSGRAGATQFATQHGAASGAIPQAGGGAVSTTQEGQSSEDDSAAVLGVGSRNAGVVFFAANAQLSLVNAGPNAIGLYVDLSTGALKLYYLGTPGQLLLFTVEATGALDNP